MSEHLYSPGLSPAHWVTEAESWWVASELVRRFPYSHIVESHGGPEGGMYNVLVLDLITDQQSERGTHLERRVMLNRMGRITLFGSEAEPISWWEHLESENPIVTLEKIARAYGLALPEKSAVTTPKSLAYRVISAFIHSQQHSKIKYEAISGNWLAGYGKEADSVLNKFSEKYKEISSVLQADTESEDSQTKLSHLWLIKPAQNEDSRKFFIHDSGVLFFEEIPGINLMEMYNKTGRSLPRLMSQLFD